MLPRAAWCRTLATRSVSKRFAAPVGRNQPARIDITPTPHSIHAGTYSSSAPFLAKAAITVAGNFKTKLTSLSDHCVLSRSNHRAGGPPAGVLLRRQQGGPECAFVVGSECCFLHRRRRYQRLEIALERVE